MTLADLMATMLAHPLLTFCAYCGLVITVMGEYERWEGMK